MQMRAAPSSSKREDAVKREAPKPQDVSDIDQSSESCCSRAVEAVAGYKSVRLPTAKAKTSSEKQLVRHDRGERRGSKRIRRRTQEC